MINKIEVLNNLLEYVTKNNDYYKCLYSNVQLPVKISDELPILYRSEIRKNKFQLISKQYNINDLNHDLTNGTTEYIPLDIYRTRSESINTDLNLWKRRWMVNKSASFRLADYYYNHNDYSNKYHIIDNKESIIIKLPMKKKYIEDYIKDIELMKNKNINWLIGPPSILYTLAYISVKYDICFKIDIIESVSEYLPSFYKELFEKVFNARVIVDYSCHEAIGMAFENKNNDLEIMDTVIIDEKEDKRFTNNYKRCIVTNLIVNSMPFIRYELSDLILKKGNIIKTFGFRWTEFMIIQNIKIHCSFFVNIFEQFDIIKLIPLENYQLIYNNNEITMLLLNTNILFFDEIKNYLTEELYKEYSIKVPINTINSKHFFADTVSGKMRGILKKDEIWLDFGNMNKIQQSELF